MFSDSKDLFGTPQQTQPLAPMDVDIDDELIYNSTLNFTGPTSPNSAIEEKGIFVVFSNEIQRLICFVRPLSGSSKKRWLLIGLSCIGSRENGVFFAHLMERISNIDK